MMKDSHLFEDVAKMASAAAGGFIDMKREIEAMIAARCESFFSRQSMVSREEFEIVRDMAIKARAENEALRKEIEALQGINAKKV